MSGPTRRRHWRPLAVAVCLIAVAVLLAASASAGNVTHTQLRVLQMNLCNSGIGACYTGQSVAEAATMIRTHNPDLVTLDEVCQDDVTTLKRALADLHQGSRVVSTFKAAENRHTDGAYRCLNGQPYGIGLLVRIPASNRGYTEYSGIYPIQDYSDPEERAWLCIDVTAAFFACATHLASTSSTVALAQCRYLFNAAIPEARSRGAYEPTVVAGDFNLRYGGSPDVRSCLTSGYLRADDGSVQQVVATSDFALASRQSIGMDGTTDHPALLVSLRTAAS